MMKAHSCGVAGEDVALDRQDAWDVGRGLVLIVPGIDLELRGVEATEPFQQTVGQLVQNLKEAKSSRPGRARLASFLSPSRSANRKRRTALVGDPERLLWSC